MSVLVLKREGREVRVFDLVGAVHVGRSETNDVALTDAIVSAHHCVIWREGALVWVEDLGSANGTWVDGAEVRGRVAWTGSGPVAFAATGGPQLHLRTAEAPSVACWMIEDRTAGVRVPVRTDRFVIGSGADADHRLPTGPEVAATLLVDEDAVRLGHADADDELLVPGAPFEVEGHELILAVPEDGRTPTVNVDAHRYDYRVVAALEGGPGPVARITHRRDGVAWSATDDNRAVLVYLLARQLSSDLAASEGKSEAAGWIDDHALISGIWGRSRPADEVNSLNVLIHRVRRSMKGAGLDPWFLEKRNRAVRIRVAEVRID